MLQEPQFYDISKQIAEYKAGRLDIKDLSGVRWEGDIIYDWYMDKVLSNPDLEDEFGQFNYELFKDEKRAFWSETGLDTRPELSNYIENKSKQWYASNPIMQDYENTKDLLKPYWDVATRFSGRDRKLAKHYLRSNSIEKGRLTQRPDYARIARKISWERQRIRDRNPEIDSALVKWHGYEPRTQKAARDRDLWETTQNLNNVARSNMKSPASDGYFVSPAGQVLYNENYVSESPFLTASGVEELATNQLTIQ